MQESDGLLRALVMAAGRGEAEAERSLRKLAALSRQVEALEAGARGAGGWGEYAVDELRTLRSQIRMWGKDGERYMDGRDGGQESWLGWLDSIRPK